MSKRNTAGSGNKKTNTKKRSHLTLRVKLVLIFVVVKVIPLLLITLIAWQQIIFLGKDMSDIAVEGASHALNTRAVESIERQGSDTAKRIADFLYERDDDIRYAAGLASDMLTVSAPGDYIALQAELTRFVRNKFGRLVEVDPDPSDWTYTYNEEGVQIWSRISEAQDMSSTVGISSNPQNIDPNSPSSFNARAAEPVTYVNAPLYDEISFIGLSGKELIRIGTSDMDHSRKTGDYARQFFSSAVNTIQLRDITNQKNTYCKAETYGLALDSLTNVPDASGYVNDIYVSDVIGAYVGTNYIGMYTPETVADAAVKRGYAIEYDPVNNASYAGAENPLGRRFEGIIRWVSPVYVDGEKVGYVTLALDHDHIMEFVDHQTPTDDRYTELASAYDGNYAYIWDYQCRSIAHPRHNSMYGYDPETGTEAIPWISEATYRRLLEKCGVDDIIYPTLTAEERFSILYKNWNSLTSDTAVLLNSSKAGEPVYDLIAGEPTFHDQARTGTEAHNDYEHTPASDLTKLGYVALDGRYLNNAPQCTGWMDLAGGGGSGSLTNTWSGFVKLMTAACIPYYTGQYGSHPADNSGRLASWSNVGFGFVSIGTNIDYYTAPAADMQSSLEYALSEDLYDTGSRLVSVTFLLVAAVICVAFWLASNLTNNIRVVVEGINRFRRGERQFRFRSRQRDEFGQLADAFDDMAESVVASTNSPLVITDTGLGIIYMNGAGLSFNLMTLSEVVGTRYFDSSIYPSGTAYDPILALHENREAEVYFHERSGRYYRGTAHYLYGASGENVGYIIISNDLTELSSKQMQLEAAVEDANLANAHKGEFLARMSHEIRTPMNAIVGITSLMMRKLSDMEGDYARDLERHLIQIDTSSTHLLGLINDILDISKIEAGKIEMTEETVDFRVLSDTVSSVIRPRCAEKQINFITDIEELSPSCYTSDSLRLRQVLINLLGNAVKFTPTGGTITFGMHCIGKKPGQSHIKFDVIDTGIGISDENLETIFQAFEQGGANITRRYGGTGLGLSISRRIVQLLGGDIEVKSKIGEGSSFSFDLWLNEAEEIITHDLTQLNIKEAFSGKHILLVDDVEINRMIVAEMIAESGAVIDEADDGAKAVEIFEKSEDGHYDLILMDVQMPIMDGYTATSIIRNLNRGDAKLVPIVALTANAFADDIAKALQAGMTTHVAKPVEYETLVEVLLKYLLQ